jgi:hypothetical protein
MDSGRGHQLAKKNRAAMATRKEALHGQWPWPSAAKSVLGSSHCHYKGVFTWTVAVTISRPSQY